MAAISRRGQGGRIYNNTRARVLLRRMCVKPADLTTHSPPKPFARPRTATRPSRALPRAPAAPMHARRLRDAFPAEALRSPPQRHALPEHFRSPTQRRRTPAGCAMHARRPHNAFPAEDLRSPTHSDTPFPSTSARPRSPDARPQAALCIPRRSHNTFPAEDLLPPRTATRPSRAFSHSLPAHFRSPAPRRCTPAALTTHSPSKICSRPAQRHALAEDFRSPPQHRRTPAGCAMHSPQRHAVSPSVPLRAQKNGTAQCMCDAECLGRPSLRSVIWVGEPRAVRRRCGALACRRGA